MSLKNIDLTTALRPSLLPDEVLLFVQDGVGLYEGKFKIPNYQNGHAYLTSHRVCYVDNDLPRKHSVSIDLKEVDRFEFYAGFLKSSPKVILVPKPSKRASVQNKHISGISSPSRSATATPSRTESTFHLPPTEPTPVNTGTWLCPICFYSNPVPSNFDVTTANSHTPLPPCLSCGVKPPLTIVLKAAVASAAKRPTQTTTPTLRSPTPIRRSDVDRPRSEVFTSSTSPPDEQVNALKLSPSQEAFFQCPRCTFKNHPSLLTCELCGAPLLSQDVPSDLDSSSPRTDSPGPMLQTVAAPGIGAPENIKLSFHSGGGPIFHERLKGAMTQRKWLLNGAPPVPRPSLDPSPSLASSSTSTFPNSTRPKTVGIAGLEARRQEARKNNELVIGSAFEDLEALMASAKEIVALAESFARQTNINGTSNGNADTHLLAQQSATALGLVTTKDMLGSGSAAETLYLTELSRNLAEFLTDDARGILRKAGGIMTLVDLWAIFNRARGGVELVSPHDFEKAAQLWEKLKLPVRLRRFRKSGVLVVQGSDRTDEKTVKAVVEWLEMMREIPPEKDVPWDWRTWGMGVSAREVAERFGWSVGVAKEELEMVEERGVIVREEGVEGVMWWVNYIGSREEKQEQVGEVMPSVGVLV